MNTHVCELEARPLSDQSGSVRLDFWRAGVIEFAGLSPGVSTSPWRSDRKELAALEYCRRRIADRFVDGLWRTRSECMELDRWKRKTQDSNILGHIATRVEQISQAPGSPSMQMHVDVVHVVSLLISTPPVVNREKQQKLAIGLQERTKLPQDLNGLWHMFECMA